MSGQELPQDLWSLPFINRGVSGIVFAVDELSVIKTPAGGDNNTQELEIERQILERLGGHARIVKLLRVDRNMIILERLQYPLRVRIQEFRAVGATPTVKEMLKWSAQAAEGMRYLHSKSVYQVDVGLHNLLLDWDDNIKYCDFSGSSMDGQPALSEIFALGCAIYEISTTHQVYEEKGEMEVQDLFVKGEFPQTDHLLLGPTILGCWTGRYQDAGQVAAEIRRVQRGFLLGDLSLSLYDLIQHRRDQQSRETAASTYQDSLAVLPKIPANAFGHDIPLQQQQQHVHAAVMGIPRLSQDLQPYAESVVLGRPRQATSPAIHASIQSLIIDGPSLVYFVYNRLLAYKRLSSIAIAVPTYEEINQAYGHLLQQLASRGVQIQNIFFDGGLPEAKRDVRLGRMEQLRQQLEAYRKMHPDAFPITKSTSAFASASTSGAVQPGEMEKALWNTLGASSRKPTLPAPPFMVASVIEGLRAGPWKDRVHTVPGEADMFCALAAKEFGAAILTNDSDLAVHDLGAKGRIVLLQSIEKKTLTQDGGGDGDGSIDDDAAAITAMALNPSHMAQRLDVSSLLRFGFERSLDQNVSVSLVRERARDDSRLGKYRAEYGFFAEQYVADPAALQLELLSPALDALDPRTAELVVDKTDAPHMYLTPLVEDPSRDSSWSYGADVRQLAYSLLPMCEDASTTNTSMRTSMSMSAVVHPHHHIKTVVEHARKGQRITATSVTALSRLEVDDRLRSTLQLFDHFFSPTTDRTSILPWYMLALHVVYQRKTNMGKPIPQPTQVGQLWGLATKKSKSTSTKKSTSASTSTSTSSSTAHISWDDLHLVANVHAVLYSFRMLQQITQYVLVGHHEQDLEQETRLCADIHDINDNSKGCTNTSPVFEPEPEPDTHTQEKDQGRNKNKNKNKVDLILIRLLDQLSQRLGSMPNIQDLILDVPHLRQQINRLDLATRTNAHVQLRHLYIPLNNSEDEHNGHNEATVPSTNTNTLGSVGTVTKNLNLNLRCDTSDDSDGDGDGDKVTTILSKLSKPKKKKRKIVQQGQGKGQGKGNARVSPSPSLRSTNPFDLLMQD